MIRTKSKGTDKVYVAALRKEHNYFSVFTNDETLLDMMFRNVSVFDNIQVRYTSEEYDRQIQQLDGLPFEIIVRRRVDPSRLFKCMLRACYPPDDSVGNLADYINSNREHFVIDSFLLGRMQERKAIWSSDYYFYCDDFDHLIGASLVSGGAIRRIYKTVEKEQ